MWVIKNKKLNIFYQFTILKGLYHFTTNCEEAHKFKTRSNAKKRIDSFKHLREYANLEIAKVK